MRQNWKVVSSCFLNGLGNALCLVRHNLFFQIFYIFCLRQGYDKSKRIDNFHAVIVCAKVMAGLTMMTMIKKGLDIGDLVLGGLGGRYMVMLDCRVYAACVYTISYRQRR